MFTLYLFGGGDESLRGEAACHHLASGCCSTPLLRTRAMQSIVEFGSNRHRQIKKHPLGCFFIWWRHRCQNRTHRRVTKKRFYRNYPDIWLPGLPGWWRQRRQNRTNHRVTKKRFYRNYPDVWLPGLPGCLWTTKKIFSAVLRMTSNSYITVRF